MVVHESPDTSYTIVEFQRGVTYSRPETPSASPTAGVLPSSECSGTSVARTTDPSRPSSMVSRRVQSAKIVAWSSPGCGAATRFMMKAWIS